MPKTATRTIRKLISDEEDADFIPGESASKKQKEKTTVRKIVRKEYAKPSKARLNKKPCVKRARKRTIHVIRRRTSIDEQMPFLVSTIQGMQKNVSEILLNQKSLERIVETKINDMDVKVAELTTTVHQLQHEVDSVKIARTSNDDDDDSPLPTTT
ncbi:hypothetical protein D1007_44495 [Hordeum vulgare]|nr:hypothetical protein D1007_44495 [Hordeum vulgare]